MTAIATAPSPRSTTSLQTWLSALAPFIAAGRRPPKLRSTTHGHTSGGSGNDQNARAVRTWWAANAGRADLPDFRERGPIPHRVRLAYDGERRTNPPAAH